MVSMSVSVCLFVYLWTYSLFYVVLLPLASIPIPDPCSSLFGLWFVTAAAIAIDDDDNNVDA